MSHGSAFSILVCTKTAAPPKRGCAKRKVGSMSRRQKYVGVAGCTHIESWPTVRVNKLKALLGEAPSSDQGINPNSENEAKLRGGWRSGRYPKC